MNWLALLAAFVVILIGGDAHAQLTSAQVTSLTDDITFTTVIAGVVAAAGTVIGLRIVMVGARVIISWVRR